MDAARKYIALILCITFGLAGLPASADSPQEVSVKLFAPNGAQGTAFCVKTLKDRQLFATAAHVIAIGQNELNSYWGGPVYKLKDAADKELALGTVVAVDAKNDIAVVSASTSLPVAVLGTVEPTALNPRWSPGRTSISISGFAAGKWLQTRGYFSFATKDTVFADCIAVPGQSGGPVTIDDKVVGVISGGQAWYPYQDEDKKGNVTWPARCGGVEELKKLIEKASVKP